ncbi:hypothetical protein [Rufibacter roseus]|uniref:DUF805 domain-containing protein n=2 Tax=Rufibacter roseus TaxID=1567108 RepID=A0ABW2DP71_9BACT|nr:hypothetical protein [Rufibacter roseus]
MLTNTKIEFWIVAIVIFLVLAILTTTGDILDTNNNDSGFVGLIVLPTIPGFILYVLVTGDIHGWQPGPIGQVGRIIVTTVGAWMFWTPLIYWIYKKKFKNGRNINKE